MALTIAQVKKIAKDLDKTEREYFMLGNALRRARMRAFRRGSSSQHSRTSTVGVLD